MAYLLPPELVWGCLPSPLLLSRGLGMEETCQPGLVAHSTRSLAPDYSFQTQFVALPRAAASPEHVTRLFPPPYPPTLGPGGLDHAAGSLPGPTAAQRAGACQEPAGPPSLLSGACPAWPRLLDNKAALGFCLQAMERQFPSEASGPDSYDCKLGQTRRPHRHSPPQAPFIEQARVDLHV